MTGKSNSFLRLGGAAGIGFAALILLLNLLVLVPAGLPSPGAGVEEAIAFFGTGPVAMDLGSMFLPAVWVLATLFGAAAVAATRETERAGVHAWALVGFAGILLQNLNVTTVSAVRLALAHTEAADAPAALWAFHEALFGLNGTFLALALIGLSMSGRRAGLVPVWLAVVGYAAAVLQFTSAVLTPLVMDDAGPLGRIGLAGWLLWVAWLAAYGTMLLRHRIG
ncbi:2-oxoglutarate/malate transporter [Glycomyces sp. NPDC047010]|uniref:2-oxoglutarate/malate transporter n=1 Tax=Glycomyces sp. NPDC047010 TaxID=3155023 RepID=UPI0033FA8755